MAIFLPLQLKYEVILIAAIDKNECAQIYERRDSVPYITSLDWPMSGISKLFLVLDGAI